MRAKLTAFAQELVIETVLSGPSTRKTIFESRLYFRLLLPLDVPFGKPMTAVIFGNELGMLDANVEADANVLEPISFTEDDVPVGLEEGLLL